MVRGRTLFALRVTVPRGGGRDSVADHDDGHDQRDHEHHAAHPDDDDGEEVKPECLYQVPGHGRACTGEPLSIYINLYCEDVFIKISHPEK